MSSYPSLALARPIHACRPEPGTRSRSIRATRLTLSKTTKQSRPLATTPLDSSTAPARGNGINSASLDSRTRRRDRAGIVLYRALAPFGERLEIVVHTEHAAGEPGNRLELPILDLALDPPVE